MIAGETENIESRNMILWLLRRFRYVRDLETRLTRLGVPRFRPPMSMGSRLWFDLRLREFLSENLPLGMYHSVVMKEDDSLSVGTIQLEVKIGTQA